jgi:hypothetical protein
MTMNSKIPGISLIQDTSKWFSVVERTKKEHPAVSFSQIMMRAGIPWQLNVHHVANPAAKGAIPKSKPGTAKL